MVRVGVIREASHAVARDRRDRRTADPPHAEVVDVGQVQVVVTVDRETLRMVELDVAIVPSAKPAVLPAIVVTSPSSVTMRSSGCPNR